MKPILMNTEMVKATLDGTKTVTRRLIRAELLPLLYVVDNPSEIKIENGFARFIWSQFESAKDGYIIKLPYQIGDVLYLRETWQHLYMSERVYIYKADSDGREEVATNWKGEWRPSIHMPKSTARIFLRVTDVRVERLKDITDDDLTNDFGLCKEAIQAVGRDYLAKAGWNSTIKKSDLDEYGWNANPWVWVIEFERISKEEANK